MTRKPQRAETWQFPALAAGPDTGVVDGDTVRVHCDLGFFVRHRTEIRLKGIDTAEIHGVDHDSDEFQTGTAHRKFVEQWLDAAGSRTEDDWPLVVETEPQETGKYGRWIGDLKRVHDDEWLSDALVEAFGDGVLDAPGNGATHDDRSADADADETDAATGGSAPGNAADGG